MRYGAIIDTGAVDSLTGSTWANAFVRHVLQPLGLESEIYTSEANVQYTGIGGSRSSSVRARFPCGLGGCAYWEAALVEEDEEQVARDRAFLPALWGLLSLLKHKAVIDLTNPNDLYMTINNDSNQRIRIPLDLANGHLVAALDVFPDQVKNSQYPNPNETSVFATQHSTSTTTVVAKRSDNHDNNFNMRRSNASADPAPHRASAPFGGQGAMLNPTTTTNDLLATNIAQTTESGTKPDRSKQS
jgi:hypothetical protein